MRTKRIQFLDNAKFILIFLVVFAHGISEVEGIHHVIGDIWTFINLFHMPAFIFISGYLARGSIEKHSFNLQRPFTYLLYYLAAQISAFVFDYFLLGIRDTEKSIIYVREAFWFLQILVIYFLMLPVIIRFKRKYMMILIILAAFLISFDEYAGHSFSIHRAFVHLPFFAAGLYFPGDLIDRAENAGRGIRIAAGAVFAGIFAAICFGILNIPQRIITAQFNYYRVAEVTSLPVYLCWIWRVIFYITASLLAASFMMIIPRRHTFFTALGSRTLAVYVFHRFLYMASGEYGWVSDHVRSWASFGILVLILIAVTFVLSLKVFDLPFAAIRRIRLDKFLC